MKNVAVTKALKKVTELLVAGKKDETLESYLDRRAALYQMEGAPDGVKYIDTLDEIRKNMENSEDHLHASIAALKDVTDALS